jgi:hypothetical protein
MIEYHCNYVQDSNSLRFQCCDFPYISFKYLFCFYQSFLKNRDDSEVMLFQNKNVYMWIKILNWTNHEGNISKEIQSLRIKKI